MIHLLTENSGFYMYLQSYMHHMIFNIEDELLSYHDEKNIIQNHRNLW